MGGAPGAVPFVGLTGGMGAGKSAALAALERLGAATLSTDAIVHDLLASDEVRVLVVERLGPESARDGAIDRDAVARIVFERPEERAWLEGILWPRVGARVAEWREAQAGAEPPPPAAVVEVPLLFEAGMEAVFDHTIAVVTDDAIRSERTAGRTHSAREGRDARQLSQDEKAARATFVVRNDGTFSELEGELSQVLDRIRT